MLRKSITAAVIAVFEILLTLDQWDGISKIITAAVVFWGMTMFLLIRMEEEDAESIQRASKAQKRKC